MWIFENTDILSVIIGGFLGAAISFVAFLFRSMQERKYKINEALFQLLGVWRTVALLNAISSDKFFRATILGLRRKYPSERIPDELADNLKKAVEANLPKIIGIESGKSLSEAYESSVKNLSQVLPIKAHQLLSNTYLIGFMQKIDGCIPENEKAESGPIVSAMRSAAYKEALLDLEGDLIYLARKSGAVSWFKVRLLVKNLRSRMRKVPDEIVDEYIEMVFVPFIEGQRIKKESIKNIVE